MQHLTYAYDANDNITSITDGVTPANSQALGYDVLNRLTSATGAYGDLGYTYDPVGNRLKQTLGAVATTYSHTPGTNRLSNITAGGSTTPVAYIASGNISSIPPTTGAPLATLTYNAANRPASVTGTPLTISGMVYDAFGQRLSKSSGGTTNYFTYGQDGSLLEEDDAGFQTDYAYLNGRPVAEIVPSTGKLYYLHADRLGTPQLATDSNQNIAWSTTYQPFGTTSLITGSITQNLRFPGQYFDAETGFSYNLNRDYMPSLGRYTEVDPVGLVGGLNTYVYANGNPGRFTDRLGLDPIDYVFDQIGDKGKEQAISIDLQQIGVSESASAIFAKVCVTALEVNPATGKFSWKALALRLAQDYATQQLEQAAAASQEVQQAVQSAIQQIQATSQATSTAIQNWVNSHISIYLAFPDYGNSQ